MLDYFIPQRIRNFFTDTFTLHDNPVFVREERRDRRRKDKIVLIGLCLGIALLALTSLDLFLNYLHSVGAIQGSLPIYIGGSYPRFFFYALSMIHFIFVQIAVFRRTSSFFLTEYRQNTLQTLLCTRIEPFQLVLQSTFFPFLQTLAIIAAPLPLYAYLVGCGGCSLLEMLALFSLFTMMGFRPPRWPVPVFAGIPADVIQKRQRSAAPKTWGDFWLYQGLWIYLVSLSVTSLVFGSNWGWKCVSPILEIMPTAVQRTIYVVPLTLASTISVSLFSPALHFQWHIAPIVFIFPLYLFARLMSIWESSIFLRTGDVDTGTQMWDLGHYWRLRRIYGLAIPFLLMGFLWKPYVGSGRLSGLLFVNAGLPAQAEKGLWWLAGCLTALIVWARVREVAEAIRSYVPDDDEDRPTGRTQWMQRLQYVFAPMASIYGMVFLSFILAGTAPFNPGNLSIAAACFLLTLAGIPVAYGLPGPSFMYIVLLVAPMAGWVLPYQIGGAIAGLSPVTGFVSLSEHAQRILDLNPSSHSTILPWFMCLPLSLVGGVIAHFVFRNRVTATTGVKLPTVFNMPSKYAKAVTAPEVNPVPAGNAPPVINKSKAKRLKKNNLAKAGSISRTSVLHKVDTPLATAFIRWFQGIFDNAVCTKELRVLLRGRWSVKELKMFGIFVAVMVVIIAARYDFAATFLSLFSVGIFGINGGNPWRGSSNPVPEICGGLAVIVFGASTIIAFIGGPSACSTTFVRERDRSTLGFLLVTPMPTSKVILGKLVGSLVPILTVILPLYVLGLVLTLPLFAFASADRVLLTLGLGLYIPVATVWHSGTIALAFSSICRRETDAGGFAVLLIMAEVFGAIWLTVVIDNSEWVKQNFQMDAGWLFVWIFLMTVITFLFSDVAITLLHWRLNRMRFGNIAFESSSVQA
ncbi:MAG: ABC transporter permease subunit [Chthonomonadales bacterium]